RDTIGVQAATVHVAVLAQGADIDQLAFAVFGIDTAVRSIKGKKLLDIRHGVLRYDDDSDGVGLRTLTGGLQVPYRQSPKRHDARRHRLRHRNVPSDL